MNELTYTRCGDYYIPDLELSEQPEAPIGKYGRMRQRYLKEHRPGLYSSLILSEKLYPHLLEIDRAARERIDAMLPYQDQASGMWYQVVNRGGIEPNYLETSGSAIFAYAIMKSARIGLLPPSYFAFGEKAFDGICSRYLSVENGELQLDGICLVAGLGNTENREGTFEYYMREPIVKNEAKGIAPLILAYIEILMRK